MFVRSSIGIYHRTGRHLLDVMTTEIPAYQYNTAHFTYRCTIPSTNPNGGSDGGIVTVVAISIYQVEQETTKLEPNQMLYRRHRHSDQRHRCRCFTCINAFARMSRTGAHLLAPSHAAGKKS